jgi:prepilin-type N-terminal cleavage/methylation domain-containing protein
MKTQSTICSRCWRPAGLTLIEVVAAITILGTILAGVVLAKSRHTRQLSLTQRRNVAVRAAGDLITGWWTSPSGVPTDSSGAVQADPSLVWQTRQVENDQMHRLGAVVVRVEIHDANSVGPRPPTKKPLVAVELVLADPAQQARSHPNAPPRARGGHE